MNGAHNRVGEEQERESWPLEEGKEKKDKKMDV